MKIEVKAPDNVSSIQMPCLMESVKHSFIILATGVNEGSGCLEGTVLLGKGFYNEGHHSKAWDTISFSPFKGTITLSNY